MAILCQCTIKDFISYLTVRTGHSACFNTPWLTLPKIISASMPLPAVPITIIPQSRSRATLQISLTGSPAHDPNINSNQYTFQHGNSSSELTCELMRCNGRINIPQMMATHQQYHDTNQNHECAKIKRRFRQEPLG